MDTHKRLSKPEVLAPAGDWECLQAAVANGADAVYFGLTEFNARHRAHNFTPAELPRIMQYLHERNVKGYLTFNILIFTQEFPAALKLLEKAKAAEVDAVIVQDLGLAYAIQQLLPGLAVHGSTQMTMTEPHAINLVKELGIQRVILARELSVTDIGKIRSATEIPLEVFVHGALCVSYSGQCLTSEALGGRSANRGQCAQACRLPYELIVDGKEKELEDRSYLLSPQDLAAHELVPELMKHGIVSFKIEGRLKKADYVAATVQAYRRAMDGHMLDKQQKLELEQTFSRGLTTGFLGGINHQTLVPGRSPKKRGISIGKVIDVQKSGVSVQLADTTVPVDWLVKAGDGIVFDAGRPEEDEVGGRVWKVLKHDKHKINIVMDRESFIAERVQPGNLVWKTDDPALHRKLQRSYRRDVAPARIPVVAKVQGKLGSSLTLVFQTKDGLTASSTWPGPLEKASKHPATLPMLREQLGRLHDTPFELADIDLQLEPHLMIPKSVLNELRRRVLVDLILKQETCLREKKTKQSTQKPISVEQWREALWQNNKKSKSLDRPKLGLLVRTMSQLRCLLQEDQTYWPSLVYCDFEDVRQYREAVLLCNNANVPVALATLRIIKPGEESWLKLIASYKPHAILARNLTSVAYYSKYKCEIPLLGDFSLNITNEITSYWMLQQGLTQLTPGFDLNWEQLQALVRHSNAGIYEIVVHYHMPMFHNEHCVFAALLSQGKDWRDCGRPCDRHQVQLRDRSGALFPVLADAGCRNTIYNALPQSAAEYIPAMLQLGIRHYRIELLKEDPSEIKPLLQTYWSILRGEDDGKSAWRKLQVTQQLGVTRGTLQLV